ncbi:MAG: beta-glucosidase BglX [Lentimicrobiaceae bacterium]|nr:beta-glucosidase BglX [Lentimicrobiaceae bacterium]MCO5265190.1 beta-glucosidase BglX [Lentimicrobium sp.]
MTKNTQKILVQYFLSAIVLLIAGSCNQVSDNKSDRAMDQKISELISKMTLEEKVGQLNQLSNPYQQTGTGEASEHNESFDEMVANGEVGSFLNVLGVDETMRLQKIAVEKSRLGIPLIFGYDVIHGYKTLFPVPLAEAASFDRSMMEKSARIAAIESAANGLHWTFAPMVDISRDPRWGRIMEGAGEDVYLGEQAAIARVHGFQGKNLSDANTIAACAKHFAAYGAAIGGRDYNAVDMSERQLREVYLPPYKAAVDAGVATFMSSFNTLNGIPASGSRWLQTEILRHEWGFDGFVVSDWNSLGEMMFHGNVASEYEVGYRGVDAGVDMDMEGRIYINQVKQLLDDKKISITQIDEMVTRVLRIKFRLGLFDNPFQYCDKQKEKELTMHPDHLAASREVAEKSIVLLKNENKTLPITSNVKRIAVIGPLANDKDAPLGNWRGNATPNTAVSLLEGMKATAGSNYEIMYAEGCKLTTNEELNFFTQLAVNTTDRSGFAEAIATAKKADVVVMALGETAYMSGECRSYADISLKGLQLELLREIRKTGKPIILTLFTGRPLVLTDVVEHTDAILNCWLLGTESGNAIANVLFGKYNPSGKLPASFPYHVGQIPVYYEQMNTGRPYNPNPEGFSSKYRDIPNAPLFAFGYGLSYTTFEYSNLKLSATKINLNEKLTVKATITNTGEYNGEEVAQLYIRDVVGNGVSRPLLQLKGFEKIMIEKGSSKEVTFDISPSDLAFFRMDNKFAPEAGKFEVFVGTSSDNLKLKGEFDLVE